MENLNKLKREREFCMKFKIQIGRKFTMYYQIQRTITKECNV